MRLYSYTLRVDDGAAPNPYGGVCTLTICKPTIRRHAKVGDWVVGLAPQSGGKFPAHVIYAMRVSRVLKLLEYDRHFQEHLPSKIPSWSIAAPFERQVGDCIYTKEGNEIAQRLGVHNQDNLETDLRGENALLAEELFYYFGDAPIHLPQGLRGICHPMQGHKVHANDDKKDAFVAWALDGFGEGRCPKVLYGQPMHRQVVNPTGLEASWSACGQKRVCAASEDEPIC